jgi:hypothetical protein
VLHIIATLVDHTNPLLPAIEYALKGGGETVLSKTLSGELVAMIGSMLK